MKIELKKWLKPQKTRKQKAAHRKKAAVKRKKTLKWKDLDKQRTSSRREAPLKPNAMQKPNALQIAVRAALVLAVLIAICAVAFWAMQASGKNRLYGNSAGSTAMSLPKLPETEEGADAQGDDWQEGDVRYQGIHYRYNEDILTFLFLGIDKMTEVAPAENGIDGGQSDAIFLLVLNPHNKEINVIGIPRDTMAEIEVYNKDGTYKGTATGQITLQHGYGDGGAISCERSREAVSKLFYNLPIHGYCAINMGAIPLINDAVGGVELEAIETMDYKDFHVKKGEKVHLKGMASYYYLHNRDVTQFNSANGRLARQKQYLTAYAATAMKAVKEDISLPVSLYKTLSRYMVTDISVDEVSYLAVQMLGYHFEGENMCSLDGETVQGEKFEEFHLDEAALYELILKVFYEEIG